jgi:hypothetical protein
MSVFGGTAQKGWAVMGIDDVEKEAGSRLTTISLLGSKLEGNVVTR